MRCISMVLHRATKYKDTKSFEYASFKLLPFFLKKTLQLCKIDGFSDADLGPLQYPRWSSL